MKNRVRRRKRLDINKQPEKPLSDRRYYEVSYLEKFPFYEGERRVTVWRGWGNVLFEYTIAKRDGVAKSFVVEEVVGDIETRRHELAVMRKKRAKGHAYWSLFKSIQEAKESCETGRLPDGNHS